jgi:hypothetical protein
MDVYLYFFFGKRCSVELSVKYYSIWPGVPTDVTTPGQEIAWGAGE